MTEQRMQIMVIAVGHWRMFKTGWSLWWRAIGVQYGIAFWCGFVAADTMAYVAYRIIKAIALIVWSLVRPT